MIRRWTLRALGRVLLAPWRLLLWTVRPPRRWRLRSLLLWPFRLALRGGIAFAIVSVALVMLLRVVNPPINLYQGYEWARLGGLSRDWVPIHQIAPEMRRAAIAAEDAKFCDHYGFDLEAIREALAGGARRGGSTISQQVAKNVFLWQERSWIRKGLEAGFTVLIEAIWPKRRILEVYLNVAEFDEGVFGAEAGARRYFGTTAQGLSATQAARMAAVLPNPKARSASNPSSSLRRRAAAIADGAATLRAQGRDTCVL